MKAAKWNVKRIMAWTPVQVGGEYSPVDVTGQTTFQAVHRLNINRLMHNHSGHLPHTF